MRNSLRVLKIKFFFTFDSFSFFFFFCGTQTTTNQVEIFLFDSVRAQNVTVVVGRDEIGQVSKEFLSRINSECRHT